MLPRGRGGPARPWTFPQIAFIGAMGMGTIVMVVLLPTVIVSPASPQSIVHSCVAGYVYIGHTCEDLDECVQPDACHSLAICTNLRGTWNCSCPDGYTGDGFHECEEEEDTAPPPMSSSLSSDPSDVATGFADMGSPFTSDPESPEPSSSFIPGSSTADAGPIPAPTSDPIAPEPYSGSDLSSNGSDNTDWSGSGSDAMSDGSPDLNNSSSENNDTDWSGSSSEVTSSPDESPDLNSSSSENNDTDWSGSSSSVAPPPESPFWDGGGSSSSSSSGGGFGESPMSPSITCDEGLIWDDESSSCVDMNECLLGTHDCDLNATCTNLAPGYNCTCDTFFQGNGTWCLLNECASGTHSCGGNATCFFVDLVGHHCECNEFYALGDSGGCEDLDECFSSETNNCDEHALCINAIGTGYDCQCYANFGYVGNGSVCTECPSGYWASFESNTCVNINECLPEGANNCSAEGSICTDLDPGFSCACNTSALYSGDGWTCLLDTCQTGEFPCPVNHTMCQFQFPDGASCVCNLEESMQATDGACIGFDLCFCTSDERAICIPFNGTYQCGCGAETNMIWSGSVCIPCDPGYQAVDNVCQQSDACILGLDACDPNADCINLGALEYECICLPGFSGNGISCVPDGSGGGGGGGGGGSYGGSYGGDDCLMGTHDCAPEGSFCTFLDPGYMCLCNLFYEGDGFTCILNECMSGDLQCGGNASCSFVYPNGSSCICDDFFTWIDEEGCRDLDECGSPELNSCSNQSVCQNLDGMGYLCLCNTGYSSPDSGVTCNDDNECVLNTDNCNSHAQCNNTQGSFTCQCLSGYTGDGISCSDVNECTSGTHHCQAHSTCVNSVGSYTCPCNFPCYYGNGLVSCTFNSTRCGGGGDLSN